MFGVNTREVKQLERDLKRLASDAMPFAARKTVNDAAFQAQRIARVDVARNMINRNRYTVQSIQVERARHKPVAIVGSVADYMEAQEFGATKSNPTIATSYSAGQGEDAQPRTRLPRKQNAMANIRLQRRRKPGTSKRQRNYLAIQQAASSGRKYVYLDLGRSKGIFRVTGGKRRPKIKMVHDMSRQSVTIPRNPWLKPAFDEAARMLPAFYADALRFQLRRRGLLR